MDIVIYGYRDCDDKFADNPESCNTSAPEHADRDTSGKQLRRGPEMLVVS